MAVLGPILRLVDLLFYLLYVAIIIEVLLSWAPAARDSPAGHALHRVTRVILDPIRRIVPPAGPLDLSPFVAILLLLLVRRIVKELLVALFF